MVRRSVFCATAFNKETGGLCGAVYVAVQHILEGDEGTPSKMLEDSAVP